VSNQQLIKIYLPVEQNKPPTTLTKQLTLWFFVLSPLGASVAGMDQVKLMQGRDSTMH
jgi:hypothetical protein